MAIELCSDDSGKSPRIFFCHQFPETDTVTTEQHLVQSSSSESGLIMDSEFSFDNSMINIPDSPSAGELFHNGKIVPVEIKNIMSPSKQVLVKSPLGSPPFPPLRAFFDAEITSKDSSHGGSKIIKKNASNESSIDQEFSSTIEHFPDEKIILPVRIKKKTIIPQPFSPLRSFLEVNDFDEDTNEDQKHKSLKEMIKIARKTSLEREKQNAKPSCLFKRSNSMSSGVGTYGGSLCRFPFFCRSNSDVVQSIKWKADGNIR